MPGTSGKERKGAEVGVTGAREERGPYRAEE